MPGMRYDSHSAHLTKRLLRLGSLTTGLLMADITQANWYGPEPFRRDRVEGRDFKYEAESFLHRLSYEPMPLLLPERRAPQDGIAGTGGSTRSNELYVRQQVQLTLPTDNAAYLGYRFFRFEDFDGHYDQQHLGAGYQTDEWRLVFWGDVTGNKGETSMQLEWAMQDTPDHGLRIILAAPDALYNRKSEAEDEYQKAPLTWYASGRVGLTDRLALYGFLNLNQPTRFHSAEMAAQVDDEQLSGGVGLGWRGAVWHWGLELEGLEGERTRQPLTTDVRVEQRLSRQFHQITAEARRPLANRTGQWLGVRHLRFDEADRQPHAPQGWLDMNRKESYLYAGHQWRLGQYTLFSPTLIGGYVEVDEVYPLRPSASKYDTGFIGKLTPVFVFELGHLHQGSISLSPTLYLHTLGFGGGNIQLYFPL